MIRRSNLFLTLLITVTLIFLAPSAITAGAQGPVVHAVLFYSPACSHCEHIIQDVLPVLDEQYGTKLQIYGVDITTQSGNALFANYVKTFDISNDMQAVPTLVVGDQYLIGDQAIPDQLPAIVDQGLENGGIDWPDIPGLEEEMNGEAVSTEEAQTTPTPETPQVTVLDKFKADLLGNSLSVLVLVGMIGVLVFAGISLAKPHSQPVSDLPAWLFPLLTLVGLAVASYMAFVEYNNVEAFCGPVGNCNSVQQSSYATLFGFLPVGVLGVLGYIAILIIWLLEMLDITDFNRLLRMVLWVLTLFGILFSIYLTFLEPFVIGATCMWCLSSAVIMALLFLLATRKLNLIEGAEK